VLVVDGPFSYEIGSYRLDDILAGALMALLDDNREPSPRALAIVQATAALAARMDGPRLRPMLCLTCDHAFRRGERPIEVMVALPWANPAHPPIVSPVCAKCAAADEDPKTAKAKAAWARLSPGSSFDGPGNA
jgi:hypothetical protein